MASTPESKVKQKAVKIIKAYGIYYFFPATHGFGRSGVPDIICCADGRFVAIECKAGKGKTTPLQEKEIAAIKAAGGIAVVVNENNLTMLDELLKELYGHNQDEQGSANPT